MVIRRVLVFLGLALLALIGLRGLVFQLPWAWPRDAYVAAVATVPAWVKVLIWLIATALPVGLLIAWILRRQGRKVLKLEGRDGAQMVLRQSVIVKVVRCSVAELPEVAKLRVSARNRPNGLRVQIGVEAKAVSSVRDLEVAIRQRVDDSLRRILGIQAIESIAIQLDDISLSDRVMPRREPASEAPLPSAQAPLADKAEAAPEAPAATGNEAPAQGAGESSTPEAESPTGSAEDSETQARRPAEAPAEPLWDVTGGGIWEGQRPQRPAEEDKTT